MASNTEKQGLDVDEAVQSGIIGPGRYLTLNFDFSRTSRSPNTDEATASLKREINRKLLRFKDDYTEALGESFASKTSNFIENDPNGNLADVIEATDYALQGIHDRCERSNPLWGIEGVCLFYISVYHNTF
jgi:hypothetical protein